MVFKAFLLSLCSGFSLKGEVSVPLLLHGICYSILSSFSG